MPHPSSPLFPFSAGVGRTCTGVFITIDHVLEQVKEENSVNIPQLGVINKIRRQRMKMVQTVVGSVCMHHWNSYKCHGALEFIKPTPTFHDLSLSILLQLSLCTHNPPTLFQNFHELIKNHNSLGHESPSDLDVNQSPNALDAFWPIPGLLCWGDWECGYHTSCMCNTDGSS